MPTVRNALFGLSLSCAFGLGFAMACEKKDSNSPDDDNDTLCTKYNTCDECIAGQQTKGATEGEAETECGAAVLGCWTTWDKPITCNGKEQDGPDE